MSRRKAFSLVELLLVVAIISLLLQMMLPAVQAAREAARRTSCLNNLRQLAIAATAHEAAKNALPGGGWNWRWVGEPDRGSGRRQPGGWIYNLLPYLEEQAIHGHASSVEPLQRRQQVAQMVSMVPAGFNCPTRRSGGPYQRFSERRDQTHLRNSEPPASYAKTDYAANGGNVYVNLGLDPRSLDEFDSGEFEWPSQRINKATGVIFTGSQLPLRRIRDGLSRTYLFGEKYLNASEYTRCDDLGDDGPMFQGDDADITRWTMPSMSDHYWGIVDQDNRPKRDIPGQMYAYAFGSAHFTGWNVAMCDGSARHMSYDLDPEVHESFGNRLDGGPQRLD